MGDSLVHPLSQEGTLVIPKAILGLGSSKSGCEEDAECLRFKAVFGFRVPRFRVVWLGGGSYNLV